MATLTYDAVDIIKDLIKTKWSSIRPPTVSAIWEKRSVGFVDDRKDQLIIYPKIAPFITTENENNSNSAGVFG